MTIDRRPLYITAVLDNAFADSVQFLPDHALCLPVNRQRNYLLTFQYMGRKRHDVRRILREHDAIWWDGIVLDCDPDEILNGMPLAIYGDIRDVPLTRDENGRVVYLPAEHNRILRRALKVLRYHQRARDARGFGQRLNKPSDTLLPGFFDIPKRYGKLVQF